eukprot:g16638.t1
MFESLVDQVYGPKGNVEKKAMDLRGEVVKQMRAQDDFWWSERTRVDLNAPGQPEAREICLKLHEGTPEVGERCWNDVQSGAKERFTRQEILNYMRMPKVYATGSELQLALEWLRVQANLWEEPTALKSLQLEKTMNNLHMARRHIFLRTFTSSMNKKTSEDTH